MSLENIMLGLLAESASGYDLKQAFDGVVNHFWSADIAQVYRTLQRMEDNGLVKSRAVPSDQGPPRKVYRRTAAGRKQLFAWLCSEPEFGRERHGYVAQLVFLGQMEDPNESLRFVQQMRDSFSTRLSRLRLIEANEPAADIVEMNDQDLHGFLGLQMGIATLQARVLWCDQAIVTLEARIKRVGK